MKAIRFSPLAVDDLSEIKRYITENHEDSTAAMRIVSRIFSRIDQLKQFPLLGEALEHKVNLATSYRYLVCENYLVFYRVEQSVIHIVRVLYAKSDYLNTLFKQ